MFNSTLAYFFSLKGPKRCETGTYFNVPAMCQRMLHMVNLRHITLVIVVSAEYTENEAMYKGETFVCVPSIVTQQTGAVLLLQSPDHDSISLNYCEL